jgi:predicted nucleotide-binding protein
MIKTIIKKIQDGGLNIITEKRLANGTGTQLKISNGTILNYFDNGSIAYQGKNSDQVKELIDSKMLKKNDGGIALHEVFVVYGHDETAKAQLEAMLRRWGLEPLILDQLPSEGQTIIEKLEHYTNRVKFAVILATPDDEGYKANRSDEKAYRARQNVVLELGMMLKQLGRRNVAILLKQQENMERPSDIQGLMYIPFKDDLQREAGTLLAKEMAAQGYQIDIKKL